MSSEAFGKSSGCAGSGRRWVRLGRPASDSAPGAANSEGSGEPGRFEALPTSFGALDAPTSERTRPQPSFAVSGGSNSGSPNAERSDGGRCDLHRLESSPGGCHIPLVKLDPDKAATQLQGGDSRGTNAHERIEDQVAGI